MGKSLKIVAESGEVESVGQEYLTILLALDREGQVVEQMWVIVDHTVFDFLPEVC